MDKVLLYSRSDLFKIKEKFNLITCLVCFPPYDLFELKILKGQSLYEQKNTHPNTPEVLSEITFFALHVYSIRSFYLQSLKLISFVVPALCHGNWNRNLYNIKILIKIKRIQIRTKISLQHTLLFVLLKFD